MKKFFSYVIPSVLAFALSGVYAVVDGFFVGNSIGDMGLSAVNIAYPVVAFIQAAGTGIGMGGAVYFSIYQAQKKPKEAAGFISVSLWLLIAASALLTLLLTCFASPVLELMGAKGQLLRLGYDYLFIVALGSCLQVISVGVVPIIRNNGSASFAMITMILGFITNVILDFLFVWIFSWGLKGAALATIIGQGVSMACGLCYLKKAKILSMKTTFSQFSRCTKYIIKTGIAPFGLALTPNFSLIIVNRFSAEYGGDEAIACYACISYVISVVYLILQGVGDGSQPLMSYYYGKHDFSKLRSIRNMAYAFAMFLSAISIILLFIIKGQVGLLLGASDTVVREVGDIFPIFLLAIPFISINRITTATFYATEKNIYSYILTYVEPAAMLIFALTLPPLFGGQVMIWWSTALARILAAFLAVLFQTILEHEKRSC